MTDDELIYEALREARDALGGAIYGTIPDTRAMDHARVMCQGALDVLGRRAREVPSQY